MTALVVSNALFYVFAALALFFAIAAVTTLRILRAAVYLMVVLLSTAALYVVLGANVLAGIQVLVYVGGVVVLLVFAVMLTQNNELLEKPPTIVRRLCALLGTGLLFVIACRSLLTQHYQAPTPGPMAATNPAALGRSFLDYGPDGYALPFEIISVLLLAAIIGGIVIATKKGPNEEAIR
jgi:NADH-quinone oxidoreductase subunit J